MMKATKKILFLLALTFFSNFAFSAACGSAAKTDWENDYFVTAMGRNDLRLRAPFFESAANQYNERLSKGEDIGFLEYYFKLPVDVELTKENKGQIFNYGDSFAYLGPEENTFLLDVMKKDSPETEIAVLACGSGRTVMDLLFKLKKAKIKANDLGIRNLRTLQKNIKTLYKSQKKKDPKTIPFKQRLEFNHGDALKFLEEREDNSLDYLHTANFMHFLPRDKLEFFLAQVMRVLKPGGKFYGFWQSHDRGVASEAPHAGFLFSHPIAELKEILGEQAGAKILLEKKYFHRKAEIKTPDLHLIATVFAEETKSLDSNGAVLIFEKNFESTSSMGGGAAEAGPQTLKINEK